MTQSLGERHTKYESNCDYEILEGLPVIIRATVRNYKKIVNHLEKPYCVELSDMMSQVMLYVITSIQDAVFGYYHNDEITFVLRNDRDYNVAPWNNNNIQRIDSTISSLATSVFYTS